MNIPKSFEELSDKYKKHNNIVMVSGNYENDSQTIKGMLEQNILAENISLLLFTPNKLERYSTYMEYLSNKFTLGEYEIFYIDEITKMYPDLGELDIIKDHNIIFTFPNYFLTVLSLSIARAESIGSENLWIPYSYKDLSYVTPDVEEYVNCVNELANIGTLDSYNMNLHFPLIQSTEKHTSTSIPNITLNDNHALIMFSGGLDCTVAAYIMKKMEKSLHLLNVKYGQSNRYQEEFCATETVKILNEEENTIYENIDFNCIRQFGGSALLKDDAKLVKENSSLEYVPFRNTLLINLGIIYALKNNIKYIVTGGHNDDTLSPDNRLIYFNAFQKVLNLQYCSKEILLYPVLLYLGGKAELIYVANQLGVDLKYTWSCQDFVDKSEVGTNSKSCGTCGNCSTRYHAFERVGLKDPIEYKIIPHKREKWYGWADQSEYILQIIKVPKIFFENNYVKG
ncbi:hypothetical protein C0R09_08200 [Brevibacillus laterosporus]|uniref:7-cyano-7-deazaguanine synthase n=1 Tax=Brevibacillus laterosporus TaxID=1465 RepID=UPI000C77A564|nr:7-cyano-7-deazaguanine synthase [Brevibacillus laterosporus]AUM64510.1 hypothetical protein C0R09_08200 [Brevibacillus laterosporus]